MTKQDIKKKNLQLNFRSKKMRRIKNIKKSWKVFAKEPAAAGHSTNGVEHAVEEHIAAEIYKVWCGHIIWRAVKKPAAAGLSAYGVEQASDKHIAAEIYRIDGNSFVFYE